MFCIVHFSAWSVLDKEPCQPVGAVGHAGCAKTIFDRNSETIARWGLRFECIVHHNLVIVYSHCAHKLLHL